MLLKDLEKYQQKKNKKKNLQEIKGEILWNIIH